MKISNLIKADARPVFGDTFYLVDIYDEEDPYLKGLTSDKQQIFVDRFQSYFDNVLMHEPFWSVLALTPYFSWTRLESYWDLNYTLSHTLESHQEYKVQRMTSFFERFDFRKNDFAESMHERLKNFVDRSGLSQPQLTDEILLTYFPSSDSMLQYLHGEEIDASLRSKIIEIAKLDSADAWSNLIPLIDENYSNWAILDHLFRHQRQLSDSERGKLKHLCAVSPLKNPMTSYWRSF